MMNDIELMKQLNMKTISLFTDNVKIYFNFNQVNENSTEQSQIHKNLKDKGTKLKAILSKLDEKIKNLTKKIKAKKDEEEHIEDIEELYNTLSEELQKITKNIKNTFNCYITTLFSFDNICDRIRASQIENNNNFKDYSPVFMKKLDALNPRKDFSFANTSRITTDDSSHHDIRSNKSSDRVMKVKKMKTPRDDDSDKEESSPCFKQKYVAPSKEVQLTQSLNFNPKLEKLTKTKSKSPLKTIYKDNQESDYLSSSKNIFDNISKIADKGHSSESDFQLSDKNSKNKKINNTLNQTSTKIFLNNNLSQLSSNPYKNYSVCGSNQARIEHQNSKKDSKNKQVKRCKSKNRDNIMVDESRGNRSNYER